MVIEEYANRNILHTFPSILSTDCYGTHYYLLFIFDNRFDKNYDFCIYLQEEPRSDIGITLEELWAELLAFYHKESHSLIHPRRNCNKHCEHTVLPSNRNLVDTFCSTSRNYTTGTISKCEINKVQLNLIAAVFNHSTGDLQWHTYRITADSNTTNRIDMNLNIGPYPDNSS